jgi:hypothetical protein
VQLDAARELAQRLVTEGGVPHAQVVGAAGIGPTLDLPAGLGKR